jgi:hypothetical protein
MEGVIMSYGNRKKVIRISALLQIAGIGGMKESYGAGAKCHEPGPANSPER